jgi:hypothetical protein
MALDHPAQLDPHVVLRAAEADFTLVDGRRRLDALAAAEVDRHPDEVDEVAREDEVPPFSHRRRDAVVRQESREVPIDRRRPGHPRTAIVEVASEMDVREDEEAL